jgi:hypothetical protein
MASQEFHAHIHMNPQIIAESCHRYRTTRSCHQEDSGRIFLFLLLILFQVFALARASHESQQASESYIIDVFSCLIFFSGIKEEEEIRKLMWYSDPSGLGGRFDVKKRLHAEKMYA